MTLQSATSPQWLGALKDIKCTLFLRECMGLAVDGDRIKNNFSENYKTCEVFYFSGKIFS